MGSILVWFFVRELDLSLGFYKQAIPGQATFDGIDIAKRTSAYFTHVLLPFGASILLFSRLFSNPIFNKHWLKVFIWGLFSVLLAVLIIGLFSEFKFNYQPIAIVWLIMLLLFFFVKPARWRKPQAHRWKFRVIIYVGVLLLPFPLVLKLFFLIVAYVWASRQIKLGRIHARYLNNIIYPIFIFLAGTVIYWNQSFIDQYELFENANPANAMMRVFEFGEIPFIDFISSHMLSEQVPLYCYSFINGYSGGTDALAWLDVFKPIALLVYFYFLRQILSSGSWAFAVVLLFPFLELVLPLSYWLALVSVFVCFHYFKNPNWKSIAFSILWTVFLVFWRIDIAAAHIPAFVLLIAIHFVKLSTKKDPSQSSDNLNSDRNKNEKSKYIFFKWLVLGVATISLGTAVVLILDDIYNGRIIQNIEQALSYFSASQAHAYSKIASNYTSWMFLAHHFIFPCLVLCISFFTLKSWNIKGKNLSNQFIRIALIFLSCYYFFNASRGLVRHGFIEGSDRAISSFFFLIATLFAMLQVSAKKRPWVFVLVSSTLIFGAKYGGTSTALPIIDKLSNLAQNELSPKNADLDFIPKIRTKIEKTDSLVNYLSNELNDSQTFFDFSNTPMLYFYAQRKVPSYFNQSLQNEVTEKIQRINLKQIADLDIPLVVFSHYPDNWWDNTDGVPNAIRYPVLAEWIYKNYRPDTIVAGYQIWKHKSQFQNQNIVDEKFLYPREWDMKLFPTYLKSNEESSGFTKSGMTDFDSIAVNTSHKLKMGDVVRLKLKGTHKLQLKLEYLNDTTYLGSFSFRFDPDLLYYRIPISAQVNWNFAQPNRIILRKDSTIKVESFLIEHKEN